MLDDGSVNCFKLTSGGGAELQKKLVVPKQKINSACISPSGDLIATSTDHSVSLWDIESGYELQRIDSGSNAYFIAGDPSRAEAWMPFSLDGSWLGLNSIESTIVRPVNPPKFASETVMRALTSSEKVQFHVGLEDSVNMQDN